MIEIKQCQTNEDYLLARKVVGAYVEWLDIDLAYQDFETEMARFSTVYGPPGGIFLLALQKEQVAGGVGLRDFGDGVCEMKRLFVLDRFKQQGIGKKLCEALIDEAKKKRYERMRLDTLGRMQAAHGLYRSLGFEEIEPYRFNPDPSTRYLELKLQE